MVCSIGFLELSSKHGIYSKPRESISLHLGNGVKLHTHGYHFLKIHVPNVPVEDRPPMAKGHASGANGLAIQLGPHRLHYLSIHVANSLHVVQRELVVAALDMGSEMPLAHCN